MKNILNIILFATGFAMLSTAQQNPNVLIFYVDDLRAEIRLLW